MAVDYLQVIAACDEAECASDWAQRATQRMLDREKLVNSAASEEGVRRRIDRAMDMVKRIWAPFLIAAGVLEIQ